MPIRNRTTLTVALAALLLVVAAIGFFGWSRHGQPADAPNRGEIGSAQPFAMAECKARLFDGAPAVAVMFTQPLARAQDWSRLAKAAEGEDAAKAVSLQPRWIVGDNPRMLVLPFVTPDRTYRIELAAGLRAAGGGALGSPQTCSVKSEAMPASFYFASRGVVLPAGQNGGLPIVTVNTPVVDVQFLRVEPRALPAFLEQVGGARERPDATRGDPQNGEEHDADYGNEGAERRLKGTVSGSRLDELRESAKSVYVGRFTTDARADRRNVSFLDVEKIKELQEPGVYVAVMNPPGRFGWDYQVTYFYVTDIGLHVRRHAAQTDVFATSLTTGRALRGIDVALLDDAGKTLAHAGTDAAGHAVFAGSVEKARTVLARRDKELSVISLRDPALDLSEFDVSGNPSRNQKLFVYAGRDLYRPGEAFTVSILARDADGKPLPAAAGSSGPPLTLVLKKPDGEREMTQLVRPQALGTAYYQQALSLPSNAATGRWLLEARTDPAAKRPDAQWSFQVEEFLPERMRLDLKAPERPLQGSAKLAVAVEGHYLYGAPAAGNALLGSVSLERLRSPLAEAWPGFIFGDVEDDGSKKRQDLAQTELDEAGHALVDVPVDTAERRSPMKLRASFSLLESGGRPVVRSIERTWWPAPVLVGVRPLFDRDVAPEGSLAEFELTRVDVNGKLVAAREIQVKLVREDRQWYWRYDDNRGWNSGYHVNDELVEARSVAIATRTKLALPVTYGRYRLEMFDPATQQTARYRFFAGWGAQDADDMGNRPDRVQLKLEGAPFKTGDIAQLTITPPHDGDALVTVESDRVLYQRRLAVRTVGTRVQIPIDAAWNRHDLYIGVVAFRPGSQGDRVTPSRALGLVHLPLARQGRSLKLAMSAPAKTTPDQRVPVKLKLSDGAGKPVTGGQAIVTVSAVDVGILNITRYVSPDPAGFFFGKHRYDADVLDLYGKLIEKMGGNVAKQRFGGDAAKRDTQSLPRKVRLVDLFSGPVALDANGEAVVPLMLPDFNGTLRLMAVASTADSYAHAEAEMVIAAPIVAELAMPRFIAPGDIATIALDVTNLSGAGQDMNIEIEAATPLRISGPNNTLKLADKERKVLRYTAQASDALGLAPIKVTITAGKLKLVREAALQVEPVSPLVREVRRLRLETDGSYKLDAAMADAYWAGSATVNVTLSNKPPIDVRDAVQGLLMYPYGCLEQTTSSAYPLVFIDEAAAHAFGIRPLSREERAKRLESAFSRLAGMQQPQGGFGMWSAANPYEAWLSAYVTGFLQDARHAGFAVPEALERRALAALLEQFQRTPATQTRPPTELRRDAEGRAAHQDLEAVRQAHQRFAEAAHTGYILAREQKAPLATLRTLHDEYRGNSRSSLALLHLALALKMMGDEARFKVALDEALQIGWGVQAMSTGGYGEWLGDYGSRLRDTALSYGLLHRHDVGHPRRENLLTELAGDFDKRRHFSTQERLALFLAARAAGGDAQPWSAELQSGTKKESLTAGSNLQRSFDVAALKRGITITSRNTQPLFVEVAAQGYPVKRLEARSDRISIERSWWTASGARVETREFKTGDLLIARLRVAASEPIKDGLVVDRIPAGLEIENLNLSRGPQAGEFKIEGANVGEVMKDARIKHSEYRDDRFVVAAELGKQQLDLYYLLRVVTPGKFVVPTTYAEDMYRPEVRGIGKAETDITVVDPRVL